MSARQGFRGVLLYFFTTCAAFSAVPETWYSRQAPGSNNLNALDYSANLFLAVGSHGTIVTSSNAIDWVGRSAGASTADLFCAHSLYNRYFIGGDGLILYSSDGLEWTNNLFKSVGQEIYGIVEYYYTGLGWDRLAGRSYVLDSANGGSWWTNSVPTTNRLVAIARPLAPSNLSIPGVILIAVGEGGTIITSGNGKLWMLQESGTAATLRAAVYHQGRLFVGGDSGLVLTSSNGISWTLAATLSFNIRALASSGNALVAVGEAADSGHVHVSRDGLNWPGNAVVFSRPLNAVVYAQSSFVAVGDSGLIVQSGYASDGSVNAWTKPTSGSWEEAVWSAERLPAEDHRLIALTNGGRKTIEIGPATAANFSNALAINALAVDPPADAFTELLLNGAGTNAPLDVRWTFDLGANASLVSYQSALAADEANWRSPAFITENSRMHVGRLRTWSSLTVSNSYPTIGLLLLQTNSSAFLSGGTNTLYLATLDAGSAFTLHSGLLSMRELYVESTYSYGYTPSKPTATFLQAGGALSLDLIRLGNHGEYSHSVAGWRGEFRLEGGSLSSSRMQFYDGSFTQTGGTNITGTMSLPHWRTASRADYRFSGGALISGSITLGAADSDNPVSPGSFSQSGGVHTNGSMSLHGRCHYVRRYGATGVEHSGSYSLSGGLLVSTYVSVGGSFSQSGGTNLTQQLRVAEGGRFILSAGDLATSNTVIDVSYCTPPYNSSGLTVYPTVFTQEGGTHAVQDTLKLASNVRYGLAAGRLIARNIVAELKAQLTCETGEIINPGMFTLRGAVIRPGSQNLQLGQLQVLDSGGSLDFSGPIAGAVHFRDSRDISWSGQPLKIIGWRHSIGDTGAPRLFFGSDAHALTEAQLNKLVFVNPVGWSAGNHPARILNTGEVVPAIPPLVRAAKHLDRVILSWPGDYELLTATNILGPFLKVQGAAPLTNFFDAPYRYFRLQLAEPTPNN